MEYKGSNIKVCIICFKHGEFWQTPASHLNGNGCKKCFNEYVGEKCRKNNDIFLKELNNLYGNKYDYSKVEYVNAKTKVCIICPKHGEFWQTPDNLLHNHSCQKCSNEKVGKINSINAIDFIEKARKIHKEKYDYSKVNYVNYETKVCIICPIHGEFWQTPDSHLSGNGCQICNESKLEREINNLLIENNIQFERQKKFDWLGRQSLDFYIPEYNVAIECQGLQHYKPIKYWGGEEGLNKRKKMDIIKYNKCVENKITLLYYSNSKLSDNIIIDKDLLIKKIKES